MLKNCEFYEKMWKNMVEGGQATDDNIIRRMLFARWIIKVTDTYSKYVIIIFFPRQRWLSECPSVSRYTDIGCLVNRQCRDIALSCEQDLQILSCAAFFIVYPCAALQNVKQIKFWAMSVHQQWHGCWTRLMYRTHWPRQWTGSSDLQLWSAAVINVEWCGVCVCEGGCSGTKETIIFGDRGGPTDKSHDWFASRNVYLFCWSERCFW